MDTLFGNVGKKLGKCETLDFFPKQDNGFPQNLVLVANTRMQCEPFSAVWPDHCKWGGNDGEWGQGNLSSRIIAEMLFVHVRINL